MPSLSVTLTAHQILDLPSGDRDEVRGAKARLLLMLNGDGSDLFRQRTRTE